MQATIKPIETIYNGYRFRSRLEARWAVFFDTLGVPYEYEKEGYDLGQSGWYLPDFWLPTVEFRSTRKAGLWLEIKGQEPSEAENLRCERLAKGTRQPVIMLVGPPGDPQSVDGYSGYQWFPEEDGGIWWDNMMMFMQCYNRHCRAIKVEFSESNYCYCPWCGTGCDEESYDLMMAYDAARSARFER